MMRAHGLLAIAAGCIGVASGCVLTKTQVSCTASADCDDSKICNAGSCVANSGCELFPPLSCAQPIGTELAVDYAEMQRLLPGRWLFCSGAPVSGSGMQDPPHSVGFTFADDLSRWSFLVDDGAGHPVPREGPEYGGAILLIVGGGVGPTFRQLNLTDETGATFTMQPRFADGPPLRMGLIADAAETIYVHDDTGCGDFVGGPDLGAARVDGGGAFGQSCPTLTQTSTSCPAVDGVRCSVCPSGFCAQPCHMSSGDCPPSQRCMPMASTTAVVLAGDCGGYDGYCQ